MNNSKNWSPVRGSAIPSLALAALALAACDGTPRNPDNRGTFQVNSISTGRGTVYPYRIRQTDSFGNPTSTVLNIESVDILHANVNGNNGVLPVAALSTTADLPDGSAGNQYLQFTFSHALDVDSILSNLLGNQTNSGLTGTLNVLAYDPVTEQTTTAKGRGFVNGYTYFNEFGVLHKVQAVVANGSGVTIKDSRAAGFPNFAGAADLVGKKTFTFVADTDNDLTTFETFPTGVLLRLVVTNAVHDTDGRILKQELTTATTVGDDPNPPQVLGYTAVPDINPGNGVTGVDPATTIIVRFNKPVQPGDVGQFFDPTNFTPPLGGLTLSVTAAAQTFSVIYHADPLSYSNLCDYRITPAYNMPGEATVTVSVQTTTIHSLTAQLLGSAVATNFVTGAGQGIINAPVAPEALYIGLGGANPGMAVIDLDGFGQGTGDNSVPSGTGATTRFPLNPNIGQPLVVPALAPGTTNLDAGSKGILTLVQDTNLNTRLLSDPLVGEVVDAMLGAPLDLVFNNENINVNATRSNQVNPWLALRQSGNTISQPPHPNPPRLVFPPPNPNRAIFGEEPTITSSTGPAGNTITTGPPGGCKASPLNLLVQGNPFASQQGQVGIYGTAFTGTFYGPQTPPLSPPPPTPFCPFTSRQQVGHFLYVLDPTNRRVVVVNSNRFTILDSIQLSDPVSMAMSPNLTRLAVTNNSSSTVSFIDINPQSPTFDTIVAETRLSGGGGATGVAWQPEGEDILVVSPGANLMSIISGTDYTVRRTVSGFLNAPIEVAVTERFTLNGFAQGVYYAYILNGNGTIAVYESGPDGVNGIGFNDIIGTVPNANFPRAQAMIIDITSNNGAVLIGHVDDQGLGQVSRLELTTSPTNPQPLNPNSGGFILPPTYRQKEWTVTKRYGGINATTPGTQNRLTGNSVVDIAMDEMNNAGGLNGLVTTHSTLASATPPWGHSAKSAVKVVNGAAVFPINPKLLFVAESDVGKVDVFEIATGTLIGSIDAPGVRMLCNYWRQ